MDKTDLSTRSISELHEDLREGRLTAVGIAERVIENYARRDEALGAYKTFDPEALRAHAEVADAAFAGAGLIEYSFAEPRFHPTTQTRADPSIHFRHRRHANVAWCDGHVEPRQDFRSIERNVYRANPEAMRVGWFGPEDNSLFDLD